MPTSLLLVRHAETENVPRARRLFDKMQAENNIFAYPSEKKRQALPNPDLSELGRVQVRELAARLGPEIFGDGDRGLVITSPMQCALETALPLVRRAQVPREHFICHPELFALGSHLLYRERPSELVARLEADFGVTCCEVPADADYVGEREDVDAATARIERTWAWLEGILADSSIDGYHIVTVIGHGHLFSRWLQGVHTGATSRLAFAHDNTGISSLTWWKEGLVIESLNRTSHLREGLGRGLSSDQPFRYLDPLESGL